MDSRVVLIKGSKSEWYEQAIFILKHPTSAASLNLVQEAENIISNYMATGKSDAKVKKIDKYRQELKERMIQRYPEETNAMLDSKLSEKLSEKLATTKTYDCAAPKPAAAPKKTRRKIDKTSFLINICLVLCSLCLGVLLQKTLGY